MAPREGGKSLRPGRLVAEAGGIVEEFYTSQVVGVVMSLVEVAGAERGEGKPVGQTGTPLDCLVVARDDGRFWNGDAWVKDWKAARHFVAPPLADPWLECDLLCQELSARLGVYCAPEFFTTAQVFIGPEPPGGRQGRGLPLAAEEVPIPRFTAL
jgi:hypothetical protein